MSTRSLTIITDEKGKDCLTMYRHCDGYPSGHGQELADFLMDFSIVNGLGVTDNPKKVANGLPCLAAQLVAAFKEGPGNIYLYPTGTKDCWEEYVYQIIQGVAGALILKVFTAGPKGRRKLIWQGYPENFSGHRLEKQLKKS